MIDLLYDCFSESLLVDCDRFGVPAEDALHFDYQCEGVGGKVVYLEGVVV